MSLQSPIKQTDLTLIVGRRGSGKSNLTKILVKSMLASKVFEVKIIDPLKEFMEFNTDGIQRSQYIDYGEQKQCEDYLKQLRKENWKGMLVIDEADGFFPNRINLLSMQKKLIHIGRHWGIGVIFVTRRLANLHTDIVSQAHKILSFRLFAGADANYLDNMQLGELIEPIWNLSEYEFVMFDSMQNNPEDRIVICNPVPLA